MTSLRTARRERSPPMRVVSVVGARPQFIKAAIVSRALRARDIDEVLVHTGQHYSDGMSDVFFRDLPLPLPDRNLGVGSGSHGEQTSRMMAAIEAVFAESRPDRVLVYGDTNSTIAAALAAAKLQLPVDHVEAGLRSFDRDMPEELNRVLTDHVADLLFCPTSTAVENLANEGIRAGVHLVGDVMLDLALEVQGEAAAGPLPDGIHPGEYFIATVHRASNTDDPTRLDAIMRALSRVSREIAPVVLPVHPRLRGCLTKASVPSDGVRCIAPVGYLEMQRLIMRARGVITDSGGVQKEALFHGVPCLTLRDSTEWVETIETGMNQLLGDRLDELPSAAQDCRGVRPVPAQVLERFGGGKAGVRIAQLVKGAQLARRRWRTDGLA
jgi:UDP-N-acetylglucosamine 2-epimerase